MADVERRAEAEAEAKGLTGQARKSYIGGVFNKIRQAHARVVKPGKGKTFFANLNRRNRQLARARYQEALRPHEEAVTALKQQRKHELAQLSPEKREPSNRDLTQRILASKLKPIAVVEDKEINLAEHVDPDFLRRVYGQQQLPQALDLFPTPSLRASAKARGLPAGGSRHELIARLAQPVAPPAPPKREPAERQRQHAIADAIKHGAPDFPPGTLAAAEGKPAAKPRAKYTPPRQDSWLRRQADPTDPREALSRAGSHEALYEHLKDEPMGVLENMADRVTKHGRKPGRNDRAGWARYIVEGMKQPPAQPAAKPAPSVLSVEQAANIPLTPRPEATGGRVRDPASPVDPYYLQHLYGDAQLHVALSRYTAPRLMEAVKAVQARHPGTKPAGGGRAELIAYIEQHVKGKPAPQPAQPAAMAPLTYEAYKRRIAEIKAQNIEPESKLQQLIALRGSYPRHATRERRELDI